MRVAVIGTGISGLGAAYALHGSHELVLYERRARIGGHSATVTVDYDGVEIPVDTGFIVYNEPNYPNLTALFAELGVATEPSDMSFGVSLEDGALEWSGDGLGALFAQRRNLVRPRFWRMLAEIVRFNRLARAALARGEASEESLGAFLERHRFSDALREDYLYPMAGAIWSTPQGRVADFPAASLMRFFDNHRLLHLRQRDWRTVTGGSRRYVEALTRPFRERIRTACPVVSVTRTPAGGVAVRDADGGREVFDRAILACHADQALAILADADERERSILSAIRYLPNAVYLHRDRRLMPRAERVWSAWNALRPAGQPVDRAMVVSYYMNRLQNIDRKTPLFVSLNPPEPPRPELTFGTYAYDHPQYDAAAIAAQRRLGEIQGVRGIHFAGAWCGYGFHEDGLAAGLRAAEALGGGVSWRPAPEPAADLEAAA